MKTLLFFQVNMRDANLKTGTGGTVTLIKQRATK